MPMSRPSQRENGVPPGRGGLVGALILCLSFALAVSVAVAQEGSERPLHVRLVWTANVPCPLAPALEAEVERILQRRVFDPTSESVLVVELASAADGGSQARITLFAADGTQLGERQFEKVFRDCGELTGALGVVAALLVDYRMPVESPIASTDVVTDERDGAPRSSRQGVGLAAHLSLALAHGLLPDVAAGVLADVMLAAGPRLRAVLGVATFASQTTDPVPVGDTLRAAGVFSAIVVPLRGCVLPVVFGSNVEVATCGGMDVGILQGTGTQVETPETRTRVHFTPTLSLLATFRLVGPLVARLEVAGGISVLRSPFYVEIGGTRVDLFAPRRLQAGTTLGLGIRSW